MNWKQTHQLSLQSSSLTGYRCRHPLLPSPSTRLESHWFLETAFYWAPKLLQSSQHRATCRTGRKGMGSRKGERKLREVVDESRQHKETFQISIFTLNKQFSENEFCKQAKTFIWRIGSTTFLLNQNRILFCFEAWEDVLRELKISVENTTSDIFMFSLGKILL